MFSDSQSCQRDQSSFTKDKNTKDNTQKQERAIEYRACHYIFGLGVLLINQTHF